MRDTRGARSSLPAGLRLAVGAGPGRRGRGNESAVCERVEVQNTGLPGEKGGGDNRHRNFIIIIIIDRNSSYYSYISKYGTNR